MNLMMERADEKVGPFVVGYDYVFGWNFFLNNSELIQNILFFFVHMYTLCFFLHYYYHDYFLYKEIPSGRKFMKFDDDFIFFISKKIDQFKIFGKWKKCSLEWKSGGRRSWGIYVKSALLKCTVECNCIPVWATLVCVVMSSDINSVRYGRRVRVHDSRNLCMQGTAKAMQAKREKWGKVYEERIFASEKEREHKLRRLTVDFLNKMGRKRHASEYLADSGTVSSTSTTENPRTISRVARENLE